MNVKIRVEPEDIDLKNMSVNVEFDTDQLDDDDLLNEFHSRNLIERVSTEKLLSDIRERMEGSRQTMLKVRAALNGEEQELNLTSMFREGIIEHINRISEKYGEANLDKFLTKIA